MPATAHIWLFVRVIDNYGDMGVAWRLACRLREHLHAHIHLWTDDTALLRTLAPDYAKASGISVYPWQDEAAVAAQLAQLPAADVVIETFGCELPAAVRTRIAQTQPLWLNWEYLSAEDWAASLHALPSLQTDGSAKYFWFMGFDPDSGGLLREADYISGRTAFQHNTAAQQAFRRQYRLPESAHGPNWLLFGYDWDGWQDWLHMWHAADEPITLWLAGGQIINSLRQSGIIGAQDLRQPGDVCHWHPVRLCRLPFVPQAEFDRLLWLADGALIRGEDSFVRAQWAGLPFLWHIYPQQEQAHLVKLHAFWQCAAADWLPEIQQAHQALSQELNGGHTLSAAQRLAAWQTLQGHFAAWQAHSEAWSQYLHGQSDAVERLALFMQNQLK
ncbi:putative repeat protein (TIGR03837 family) [Neisseria sp. HSC-16F19]|nr:elongation factor P maturation arginine rhamnosyltransferase EarP [Neisseria sp. HSC-16F19]MCP2041967.1 putative repeat protein (TIGR03837 family) [Neisseria sp. HSC-16F19]